MTIDLVHPDILKTGGLIGGTWRKEGQQFSVIDPATQEEIASVPDMGPPEALEAIKAASDAWPDWKARTAGSRAELMHEWAELIRQHADDLAVIMTREQGKPLGEARGEVLYSASFIDWFAEEGRRIHGEIIPPPTPDRRTLIFKEPVGVGVGITPWNFPMSMPARKAAAALAAGCTMVLKPAEQTPLSTLALVGLGLEAGLPQGVLNVLTVSDARVNEVGRVLTQHDAVRAVSFTGSTEVGKLLMEQCASTVKRVSMELGGSAPFIVLDDADLDLAAAALIACKFRNSGQMCVAANRILIQDTVYDDFTERLVNRVRTDLTLGNGLQPEVNVGPLIDSAATDKVERHVTDAIRLGGRLLIGGPQEGPRQFFAPTVIGDVTTDMAIMKEETFGPVAPLTRFKDDAEAIELANATSYGLAAYLFSSHISRLWRMAEDLEFGIVCANTGSMTTETAPFGGMKQSGIGREGSHHGIEEWLETKFVSLGGL